jgi:protein NrfC
VDDFERITQMSENEIGEIDAPNGSESMESANAFTRRDFVKGAGAVGFAFVLGGTLARGFLLPDQVIAFPASEGYLLVDSKKCQGCNTCAMACSLTHHGVQNLSLGRIQVTQDPLAAWPNDKLISQCRQCPSAPCVMACPTGANHIDTEHGNVRTIDPAKCIGCERCVAACPFDQSRADWNFSEKHAQKCDLCTNTPFWDEKGGPGGKQACVELCPVGAIAYAKTIPVQDDGGYDVNLRDATWGTLGYPTD